MNRDLKILAIVPARLGSKRIPNKNLRILCGKPLISYVLNTLKKCEDITDIVVSSDSERIARTANLYGVDTISRPSELAGDDITLDPVISHAVEEREREKGIKYDLILTVQATSPLLTVKTLKNAISKFHNSINQIDTLISVKREAHLSWIRVKGEFIKNYEQRLNSQFLDPVFFETGAFLLTKRKFVSEKTRIGRSVDVYELGSREAIDIDVESDWWLAEKYLNRKKIMINVIGSREFGLGHVYRCLTIAYRLIDHELLFVCSKKDELAKKKIEDAHFKVKQYSELAELGGVINDFAPDIIINDILNTSIDYMKFLRSYQCKRIINFEDQGEGVLWADSVINESYLKEAGDTDSGRKVGEYYGLNYYCLRDDFRSIPVQHLKKDVKRILISFGGTDPSFTTLKVLNSLKTIVENKAIEVDVILGLGVKNKADIENLAEEFETKVNVYTNVDFVEHLMNKADLAIVSAGRTLFELVYLNVPSIVIAHHEREQSHILPEIEDSLIYLGISKDVSSEKIEQATIELIEDYTARKEIVCEQKKINLVDGLENVIAIINSN